MLKGHHLVYFGPEKWDGLWRNRHQLMSRFARCNKVMYVEPWKFLKRVRHKLSNRKLRWQDLAQPLVREERKNLYVYSSPIYAPISGRFPLDRLSFALWNALLKCIMYKLGFRKPIIWISRPQFADLMGNFSERLVIYHVVDEYLAYHGLDQNARLRLKVKEQKILKNADLVIVVSDKLLREKRKFNKHTYLVANAVDFEAYAQAVDSTVAPPPDISEIPKPIIGYSGFVAARLDLGLLEYVVKVHPEWSVVLVGAIDERHCEADLARLQRKNNVYFLGKKDFDFVPYYIKGFDVCLIPYNLGERSDSSSPLKLYEYLATGKPIVATDFLAVHQFEDVVYIAQTRKDFVCAIEKSLNENNANLCLKRRQLSASNTWDQRVEQLSRLIGAHL